MRSYARSSPSAKYWKNKKKELKRNWRAGRYRDVFHYEQERERAWEYYRAIRDELDAVLWADLPDGVTCSRFCQMARGVRCTCVGGGVGHGARAGLAVQA